MKRIILFLIIVNVLIIKGQDVYSDAYRQAQQMLNSGYIDPYALQQMYNNILNDVSKKQNQKYYDTAFELAEKSEKKGNFSSAKAYYELAIQSKETGVAYNNKGCVEYLMGNYEEALTSFNKALEFDSYNTTYKDNSINAKGKIRERNNATLSIYKVEFANVDDDNNIYSNYGDAIYSEVSMYIFPKIFYTCSESKDLELSVKFYDPDGNLCSSKSSPNGYTYSTYISVKKSGEKVLTGWGNSSKGTWKSGNYRFEVWNKGCCLAINYLSIKSKSSNYSQVNPNMYLNQYNNTGGSRSLFQIDQQIKKTEEMIEQCERYKTQCENNNNYVLVSSYISQIASLRQKLNELQMERIRAK